MREVLKYVYVGYPKPKYNIAQNQSISELDFPKYQRLRALLRNKKIGFDKTSTSAGNSSLIY
jgi:hypothetical protein